MDDLPPPPVPADCDLRGFPDMPLEVSRLRDSDLRRRSNGDEFKAAILLWCSAWHQTPCGSLPDDDVELADFAGLGTGKPAVRAWQKLRPMALRGWRKHSGGRLYHPRLAEKALMAWKSKLAQRERTVKARIASLVKQLEREQDVSRSASLEADLERARQELSDHLSRTLSQGQSHPLSQGSQQGSQQGPRDQKGSDRIGSEGIGYISERADAVEPASTTPQPAAPVEPATGTDEDIWRYQVGAQPWARTLRRAGCKIGARNWRAWQGLVDRAFGGNAEACAAAAAAVPPDERWPDRVEARASGAPAADDALAAVRAKYAPRTA